MGSERLAQTVHTDGVCTCGRERRTSAHRSSRARVRVSSREVPARGPKSGGTLKAAIIAEPDTLDPAISTIYPTWEVIWNIFSTLVRIEDNGQFTGVLAKSWTQSDPKTYVFNLRNDVFSQWGKVHRCKT